MKNKKAIFFTVTAIVISTVLILSFSVYSGYKLNDKMSVIEIRIITMNNFIKDVEKDLEKGVYIASFRSLLSMTEHFTKNGTYVDDVNSAFSELFLDGTLDGQEANLMIDSTFNDWVDKIQFEADKIDVIANFTVNSAEIFHENPWKVRIKANIDMIIEDKKETSSWDINKDISTEVSIDGLEDPLYVINSLGRVTNTIRAAPYTTFVSGSDMSNFLTHINESYYITSNSSPSYLMRLEGNLSNSSFGIESLVNLQEFIDQGLSIKARSCVDYIYFGNLTTTDYRINNTPSWFRLDEEHLETYEVEDKTE